MSEASQREALFDAIRDNDTDTARNILNSGIDPNLTYGKHEVNLFHVAADTGAVDCMPLLLEFGTDINATAEGGGFGRNALHYAAAAGQDAAVAFLLENGCNPDRKTINGALPAHMASEHGHLEALKLLIAQMEERGQLDDVDRRSILQMAIIHDQAHIAEFCLDRWPVADINAQDKQGMALMHWAAHNGAAQVARLLVKRGADDTQVCGDGRTMMDFAKCTPAEVVLQECQSLRNSRKLARTYRGMRRAGP